ncbi:MAG: DUF3135 domain-containing protein [Oceanospirillaceae bacterium]|nr:DUF3135 domain-containing protein [Oceanospirillaceae bacterium]
MYELPSFDKLVALNQSNPEAFETLREQLVDGYIDTVPTERQHRLQGLQFHINSRRDMASNPLDSCISLSRMMHETFWDMHTSLEDLSNLTSDNNSHASLIETQRLLLDKKPAEVLQLNMHH